jgi:hypothetical protein
VATESEQILWMNRTFRIGSPDHPTDLGVERLRQFRSILQEEVFELNDIIEKRLSGQIDPADLNTTLHTFVHLSDFLVDIVVFCRSEAQRWGLPFDEAFKAVMDSQKTKLVDGEAIFDDRGKFIKGPNFKTPEPKIREIIQYRLTAY